MCNTKRPYSFPFSALQNTPQYFSCSEAFQHFWESHRKSAGWLRKKRRDLIMFFLNKNLRFYRKIIAEKLAYFKFF
jgi:hypothetical protein